jgi:hypothetical protein
LSQCPELTKLKGDSYSAGVGAGNLLDNPQDPDHNCLTTSGSYPKRLERGYSALRQGLEFLSCTGDVIANVNDAGSHGRATQQELMSGISKGSYKLATLSIGGNDLGFSDVVKSCIIIGPLAGDCEAALKKAESIAGISPRDSASHGDVLASLEKVYRDIIDTAGDEFTLVVTGYARFFATPEGNSACNDGQMQLISSQDVGADIAPLLPLTEDLRKRLNAGVDGFNTMIRAMVSEVQNGLERDGVTSKRIGFVDINPVFEGHRFCEPGESTEAGYPEFTERAWFFSSPYRFDILPDGQKIAPRTDDSGPKLQLDRRGGDSCSDPYYSWDCALGELNARDPNMPLNEKEYPRGFSLSDLIPEAGRAMIMKAFHPKTIAYDAIANKIAAEFGESNPNPQPEDPQDPQNPQDPGNDTMAYYVYPADGRDNSQIEEIASNLQRYVAFGGKLEASETRTFGLNYWRIPSLTVEEAMEVGNITNVRLPRECVFTFDLPILISRK